MYPSHIARPKPQYAETKTPHTVLPISPIGARISSQLSKSELGVGNWRTFISSTLFHSFLNYPALRTGIRRSGDSQHDWVIQAPSIP